MPREASKKNKLAIKIIVSGIKLGKKNYLLWFISILQPNFSLHAEKKSLLIGRIIFNVLDNFFISIVLPNTKGRSSWPSRDTKPWALGPEIISTSMVEVFEQISGLEDRLCENIGIMLNIFKSGWMIGPPADNAYAVDPVLVATIRPSDLCS